MRSVTLTPDCGQLRADALQIGLAAATLRVAGVAPAQQQHGANGSGETSATRRSRWLGSRSGWPSRDLFARRATLGRSLRLLSEFRYEQRDPARFYGALADGHRRDGRRPVASADRHARRRAAPCSTWAAGPATSPRAFAAAGMHLHRGRARPRRDARAGSCGERPGAGTFVRASGMALPFADDSVDVCLSSNVAEHVPQPWRLGNEMLRVTRPGGLVVLSYTVWLGPFGGHEMGLTHYLGGPAAADALHPQARPPAEERLRLVVVRGVGGRRAAMGDQPPARWSPHFPATTRDGRGG